MENSYTLVPEERIVGTAKNIALNEESGSDAIRVLTRAGFSCVRQRGSHVRMKKQRPDTTLTLTVPLHDELDRQDYIMIRRIITYKCLI